MTNIYLCCQNFAACEVEFVVFGRGDEVFAIKFVKFPRGNEVYEIK